MPAGTTGRASDADRRIAPPHRAKVRVVHLTSVHPRDDVRIFTKQCRSLAAAGYAVHLVAPGVEDDEIDGVHLHAIRPAAGGRLGRMTRTILDVHRIARSLDTDLYHVHDPELLPVALALRLRGSRVIYDSHEHLPQQIRTKPWIPAALRRPLALLADLVERAAARLMSAVVTAEPYVQRRFAAVAPRAVTVNNFPMLEEFPPATDDSHRERAVCYLGAITALRGAREMVQAIARTDATLLLAGRFAPAELERELEREPGWAQVESLGHLSRPGVVATMSRASAGLVVLAPVPNYLEANPTKMFEYMSAGIPVIASDFPAWSSIVNAHGCGLCVDPTSPAEIAEAIDWILGHPDEAREMGENGRRAVERLYSWDAERRTLLGLYEELVGPALTPLTAVQR